MSEKYYLYVKGKPVEVSREAYREYYRHVEREKYSNQKAKKTNIPLKGCRKKG